MVHDNGGNLTSEYIGQHSTVAEFQKTTLILLPFQVVVEVLLKPIEPANTGQHIPIMAVSRQPPTPPMNLLGYELPCHPG